MFSRVQNVHKIQIFLYCDASRSQLYGAGREESDENSGSGFFYRVSEVRSLFADFFIYAHCKTKSTFPSASEVAIQRLNGVETKFL